MTRTLETIFLAAMLHSVWLPLHSNELRVGAAAIQITPPLGIPLAGYYHERGSTGVHDDLYARAIVLEQGGIKAALVSLDLITTRRSFVVEARRRIESEAGIPGHHVMISATHAHTGPLLATERTSDPSEDEPKEKGLVLQYTKSLANKIAEAVAQADQNSLPAKAFSAVGYEDSIAFNRRFHMKDGSIGWNPGKLNPNIVKAAGPIDAEVPIVFFSTPENKAIATYVNYTVHLDNVGGSEISADLPHALTKSLKKFQGNEAVTLYTSGAAGDINHIDVNWGAPQKGHENAARMGMILAGEVLSQWPRLERVEGPLQVRSERVELALPVIDSDELEGAGETLRTTTDNTRANFMKLVQAHKVMDVAARNGRPWEVEVQVITLGKRLAWVALPGEVFVQLGLDIKLDSPFPQTMIVELANGSIGYIPNIRAYAQGNYEVVSARCAVGSGEKMAQTAVRLLKEIHASVDR